LQGAGPQLGAVGTSSTDWSNSNVSQSQMGPTNEALYASSNQSQMPANQMQQSYQQPFSALQPKGSQQQQSQFPPGQNLTSQNLNQVSSQSQQAPMQSQAGKSILQPEQQQQLQAQIQQHQQLQQQLQNQQQQPGTQLFPQTTAIGQKPFGSEQQHQLQTQQQQQPGSQLQQLQQQPLNQLPNSSMVPPSSISQQQWPTQSAFDQSNIPTSLSQFSQQPISQQGLSNQAQPPYSSQSIMGQPSVSQASSMQQQHMQQPGVGLSTSHQLGSQAAQLNPNNLSQAGPGGKSISGLLADFSKALGKRVYQRYHNFICIACSFPSLTNSK